MCVSLLCLMTCHLFTGTMFICLLVCRMLLCAFTVACALVICTSHTPHSAMDDVMWQFSFKRLFTGVIGMQM